MVENFKVIFVEESTKGINFNYPMLPSLPGALEHNLVNLLSSINLNFGISHTNDDSYRKEIIEEIEHGVFKVMECYSRISPTNKKIKLSRDIHYRNLKKEYIETSYADAGYKLLDVYYEYLACNTKEEYFNKHGHYPEALTVLRPTVLYSENARLRKHIDEMEDYILERFNFANKDSFGFKFKSWWLTTVIGKKTHRYDSDVYKELTEDIAILKGIADRFEDDKNNLAPYERYKILKPLLSSTSDDNVRLGNEHSCITMETTYDNSFFNVLILEKELALKRLFNLYASLGNIELEFGRIGEGRYILDEATESKLGLLLNGMNIEEVPLLTPAVTNPLTMALIVENMFFKKFRSMASWVTSCTYAIK